MNDETDNNNANNDSSSDIKRKWEDIAKNFANRMPKFKPQQKRVIDLYGREELNQHLRRFMEHCVAKGVNPEIPVILDWLYSEKAFNERDDFVKIDRLIEMIKNGMVFPLLILEVLEYAKKVEQSAIKVVEEVGCTDHDFESVNELEEILDTRLEIYRKEKAERQMKSILKNSLYGLSSNNDSGKDEKKN